MSYYNLKVKVPTFVLRIIGIGLKNDFAKI